MRMESIMAHIRKVGHYQRLLEGMRAERYPLGVYGVSESARAFLLGAIASEGDRSIFVLTASDMDAKNLYEDLQLYHSEVYYFPSKEVVFYNIDAISGDLRWERLKVIKALLQPGKKIVVTTVDALAAHYTPLSMYADYRLRIAKGDQLDLAILARKLLQSGYQRAELVEGRGEFALRGGLLDVFPPDSPVPCRIELFGDEVDSIRTFNPETQRSIEQVESMEVFPAKEIILDEARIAEGGRRIRKELEDIVRTKEKKKQYAKEALEKLKSGVARHLEALDEGGFFESIDAHLPFFFEKPGTFFDFVGEGLLVVDDTLRSLGKIESLYQEFQEDYDAFLNRGEILPSQGRLLVEKEALLARLEAARVLTFNPFLRTERLLPPKEILSFNQVTIYNYQGQLEMLIEDIRNRKEQGFQVVILSGTGPRGQRLVGILREEGIESAYKDNLSAGDYPNVVITPGSQTRGFEFPDVGLSVISDKEVFGEAKQKSKRARGRKVKGLERIKSFSELRKGDYVVHVNHGIGVFLGIRQMESHGLFRDYIEIQYDKNDKLFIPVEQLDMIQRYIGTEGKAPKIHKLGGSEWEKAKAKVRTAVDTVAEDLVKLYAERSKVRGHAFSGDTEWQRQFEGEFPFEETEDQLKSVEEIKADMERTQPMERLLCGDVGYGKTEVAMRAAFKSVMDGKQVAVLVPTTILAEQHYNVFRRRFRGFPIGIDMLSRFRGPREQKETLRRLREGNVDILIGTHRILSASVKFKDLGLLVVDEEQRFGVSHKEKIKQMKKNIDVLTLTATPIPRTLNMSLSGIRDISIIDTPPEDRYPIQTYVVEFNEQLVRDAILREKSRGGQVYFVHNRVESIHVMLGYLSKLVPEVNFDVAHGQMHERELEDAMKAFMDGETDVLISTTIIETGMDIQNVNTIIVNNADKLGLSQLYQLRGRVGRTNRIAYAYLTYQKDKVLTEIAEKRLRALKDFTELGSGFKIAMRDLEIRGAGNLMGKAQHGQMSVVGYDLYVKMLDHAVKRLQGVVMEEEWNTTVDIRIDAFIPSSYIADETHKIEVYKRIASMEGEGDYGEIKEELLDRYSDIPDALYNLMDIARLKFYAHQAGVEEIKDRGEDVQVRFQDADRITDTAIRVLMERYGSRVAFMKETPGFAYKVKERDRLRLLENLTGLMKALLPSESVAKDS